MKKMILAVMCFCMVLLFSCATIKTIDQWADTQQAAYSLKDLNAYPSLNIFEDNEYFVINPDFYIYPRVNMLILQIGRIVYYNFVISEDEIKNFHDAVAKYLEWAEQARNSNVQIDKKIEVTAYVDIFRTNSKDGNDYGNKFYYENVPVTFSIKSVPENTLQREGEKSFKLKKQHFLQIEFGKNVTVPGFFTDTQTPRKFVYVLTKDGTTKTYGMIGPKPNDPNSFLRAGNLDLTQAFLITEREAKSWLEFFDVEFINSVIIPEIEKIDSAASNAKKTATEAEQKKQEVLQQFK